MDNTLLLSCGVKTSAYCWRLPKQFAPGSSPHPPLLLFTFHTGSQEWVFLKHSSQTMNIHNTPYSHARDICFKSPESRHTADIDFSWDLSIVTNLDLQQICFPVKRNRKTVHIEELWLHFLVPSSIPRVVHCVSSSPREKVPEATEHVSLSLWLGGQQSLSQYWLHLTSDLLREGSTPPTRRKGPGLNELYNVCLLRADAPQQVQWL